MKIAVLGVAQTKFGEQWSKSIQDLLAESQLGALHDADLCPDDIDEIVVGNMCSSLLSGQSHLGALAADILEMNVPANAVESACSSGSLAVRTGILALLSGQAEVVLVSGVEKMTDVDNPTATVALAGASIQEQEHFFGATFPSLFAMVARAYMAKYGVTRQQVAHVSVKNHLNASINQVAHLKKKISVDDVLSSTMVADPLSLLDCSVMSDGAASLVLATPEFAKKKKIKPVYITASACAVDRTTIAARSSLTDLVAVRQAAQKAYQMAGVTPADIDVVEAHDAFSLAEVMSLEELGFFEKGQAAQATADGLTALGGTLPVNTSGGLKAKGHPVGATGVAQIVELAKQLRGECDKRQVNNPRIALAQNMGGIGTTVLVHILEKEA